MATHKPINILEAFAAAPPPLDYVLPNMVAGTVGALVSPGGAGKSMLALQLAAQIAGGPDLLEVGELPTGPVIYLPAEDPPTAIHHRLHALGAHLSAEERQAVADGLLIQPLIGSLPNIMAPEWFDGLKRAAEGRRLMVLDTLRRFHNGAVCEGSQAIKNNAPFGNADVFAREVFLRIKEFCVIA